MNWILCFGFGILGGLAGLGIGYVILYALLSGVSEVIEWFTGRGGW